MQCLECASQQLVKNGQVTLQDGTTVQKSLCTACRKPCKDRTGTPLARRRTASTLVTLAMHVRTEGMGVRATGRSFGQAHSSSLRWEPAVPAKHNAAQHRDLRRRASADRRRQNLSAKQVAALPRVLDRQRLVPHWVRPHQGLQKDTTPAMAMGYCARPITMHELFTQRGFASFIR